MEGFLRSLTEAGRMIFPKTLLLLFASPAVSVSGIWKPMCS